MKKLVAVLILALATMSFGQFGSGAATVALTFGYDLELVAKLAVTDSARIEKTLLVKGASTFGATGTQAVISTAGKVTSPDTVVSTKGFRTESISTLKGKVTTNDSVYAVKGMRTATLKLGTSNAQMTKIDTVCTATGVVRWIKLTVAGSTFYCPVDTALVK